MKHIFNVETKVGAHTVESDMFQEPKFPHKCNLTSKIGVETQGYFCWKLSEKKLGGKRSRLAWPLIFEPSERLCPLRTLISLIVTLGNSWNGLKTEKKTLFLHFIKLNNMYQLTETTGRSRSERQRRIYVTLTCTLTLQPHPPPVPHDKHQTVRTVWLLGSLVQQTDQCQQKQKRQKESSLMKLSSFPNVCLVLVWSDFTRRCSLLMERTACDNKTRHPKTSSPLSWLLCPLFFFLRSPDSFSPLAHGLMNTFLVFHEYIYVFLCVVRGVGLSVRDVFTGCGKSCPLELPAPGKNAAGPVLPPSSKLPPAKQIRRCPPSPLLCRRRKWQAGTLCPAAIHN